MDGRSSGKNRRQALSSKRQKLSQSANAPASVPSRSVESSSHPAPAVSRNRRKAPPRRIEEESRGLTEAELAAETRNAGKQGVSALLEDEDEDALGKSATSSHEGDEHNSTSTSGLDDEIEVEVNGRGELVEGNGRGELVVHAGEGQEGQDEVEEPRVDAGDFEDGGVADLWHDSGLHIRNDDDDIRDEMGRADTPPGLLDATGSDREHGVDETQDLVVSGHEFVVRDRSQGLQGQHVHAHAHPMYGYPPTGPGRHMAHDGCMLLDERSCSRYVGALDDEGRAGMYERRGSRPVLHTAMERHSGITPVAVQDKYGGRGVSMAQDARDMRLARASMVGVHGASLAGAYMHCRMGPVSRCEHLPVEPGVAGGGLSSRA